MKLLFCTLCACAAPRVYVATVAPDWQPTFEGLRADLRAAGHDILLTGAGVAIVTDAGRVAAQAALGTYEAAYWDAGTEEVVMPPRRGWVTYPNGQQEEVADVYADVLLAHELGHAMGLQHVATGLMTTVPSTECIGQAARCLIEALRP